MVPHLWHCTHWFETMGTHSQSSVSINAALPASVRTYPQPAGTLGLPFTATSRERFTSDGSPAVVTRSLPYPPYAQVAQGG